MSSSEKKIVTWTDNVQSTVEVKRLIQDINVTFYARRWRQFFYYHDGREIAYELRSGWPKKKESSAYKLFIWIFILKTSPPKKIIKKIFRSQHVHKRRRKRLNNFIWRYNILRSQFYVRSSRRTEIAISFRVDRSNRSRSLHFARRKLEFYMSTRWASAAIRWGSARE